jgi:hypothetical protein
MRNTGQNGGTAGADTRAVAGWDIGRGTGATIVAVIDDGIDHTHPDLAANMWTNPGEIAGNNIDDDGNGFIDDIHGYDFTRDTGDILGGLDGDHGTHVAGSVGAVGNNGIGVTGMTWRTRLMTLPLFSNGANSGQTSVAIQALNYAVQMGSRLSNNSWGSYGFSQSLLQAIQAAGNAGHVFVAGAGNDTKNNDATPFFPSSYFTSANNVVSVGAVDRNDNMAGFSNYGERTVMLTAPGVEILSTSRNGGYMFMQGTSMATPHVTGALAAFMDASPGRSPQEIIAALGQSVRPLAAADRKTSTGGTLDLEALMQLSGSAVFATGADAGGGPHVKVFRGSGTEIASFFAYNPNFRGGVRVATGDVNGDRTADIVTVAGPGGGPHVKVFDGKTFAEIASFMAFETRFTGGLTVATGDVNGDGRADIIVGADAGGGPRVSVFSMPAGATSPAMIANFFAYDPAFTGGVRVAAGMFTPGSKLTDVITTPGAGGGPHLKRFSAEDLLRGRTVVAAQTMVGDPNGRTGLWVSTGDMNGDGIAEYVTGAGRGTPIVTILDGRFMGVITTMRNPFGGETPGLVNPNNPGLVGSLNPPSTNNGLLPLGAPPTQLVSAASNSPGAAAGYSFGARVAVQDVNGDKVADMIVSGGPNDAPVVTLVDGRTFSPFRNFEAYASNFFGGIFVGAGGV